MKLKEGNKDLETLLGISITRRVRRNKDLPSSWTSIRERAASLFEALASSWTCPCASSHFTNLLLDDTWKSDDCNKVREQNVRFKLWFSFGVGADRNPGSWDWHHVKARTILNRFPKETGISCNLESIQSNK